MKAPKRSVKGSGVDSVENLESGSMAAEIEVGRDGNSRKPERKRIKNVRNSMKATMKAFRGFNGIARRSLEWDVLVLSLPLLGRERGDPERRSNGVGGFSLVLRLTLLLVNYFLQKNFQKQKFCINFASLHSHF